ncbi:UNVERIFIED_CONTAM: hypothetical protein NCL1_24381 [Trichonephila clavipes]
MDVCIYDLSSFQHHSTDLYENWHVNVVFCGEGFCVRTSCCSSLPGGATAYQLRHRSINRQVANMVAKNDANLALSLTFHYVSIESPL